MSYPQNFQDGVYVNPINNEVTTYNVDELYIPARPEFRDGRDLYDTTIIESEPYSEKDLPVAESLRRIAAAQKAQTITNAANVLDPAATTQEKQEASQSFREAYDL